MPDPNLNLEVILSSQDRLKAGEFAWFVEIDIDLMDGSEFGASDALNLVFYDPDFVKIGTKTCSEFDVHASGDSGVVRCVVSPVSENNLDEIYMSIEPNGAGSYHLNTYGVAVFNRHDDMVDFYFGELIGEGCLSIEDLQGEGECPDYYTYGLAVPLF